MKQFSIEVQENKVGFFMELMKSFSFVKIKEKETVFELTPKQKVELDKRFEEYQENPSACVDWDKLSMEIQKKL